ncbi:MAG: hypothetical protein EA374_05930 [Acholeplasmatales bacterium]|nr:MAG: hypothetical protein EA374_05930 [Acholeplasmatales bacterium]
MDPHFPCKVTASRNLDHDHRHVLSLLYLPLIGSEAFTLYMALYGVVDRAKLRSVSYPHAFFYDLLALSHVRFDTARTRLEACGLLETYQNDDERLYELLLPLTAERFVKDAPFAPYLRKHLGDTRYEDVLSLFKLNRPNVKKYTTLTAAFSDVFGPAYTQENTKPKGHYIDTHAKATPRIDHPFDVDLFLDSLPETLLHPSTKTQAVLERLKTMSYVYQLDETTLKDLVIQSLHPDTRIDFDQLSQKALKSVQNRPVRTITKKTSAYDLEYFKNTDPITLLEDLTGMAVPNADLKIVEELMTRSTVKLEVLNVLIGYVLRELDQRVPAYNYFDKVLAEWCRNGVEDAESAIEHIRKKIHQKREPKPAPQSGRRYAKRLPKDIEVDWFDAYLKKLEEEES